MSTEIEAKIGSRGQVVIPKPIRDQQGLKEGTRVTFHVEDGEVVVRRAEEVLEEYLDEVDRQREPEDVDWDDVHYSRR